MDENSANGSGSDMASCHRNDSFSTRRENEIVIAQRRGDGTNDPQTSDSNQEANEDSEVEEKILTVYWRAGKLGAAFFTLQTGELYILEEIVDRPPAHLMLANLFRQVEPAQVLIDGKVQSTFVGSLKELVFDNDGQGDGRCKLIFLKSKENIWDDIIGEPEGARSPECAWRLSNLCFQHSRNWCYTVMAVLVAPPCALIMGCCFACLAFEQIWCMAPCLRCVKIYFATLRTLVMACMATFLVPVADAFGHCCRNIRVNMRKEAPDEKDFLIV